MQGQAHACVEQAPAFGCALEWVCMYVIRPHVAAGMRPIHGKHDQDNDQAEDRTIDAVLDSSSGLKLWELVIKSEEDTVRTSTAFQWHPSSRALFFFMHEHFSDDLGTMREPDQPCAIMFSAGEAHECEFWEIFEDEDFMDVHFCIPSPAGSWVACFARHGGSREVAVLQWPSGQIQWHDNDLFTGILHWDSAERQVAYLQKHDAETHRCKLNILTHSQSDGATPPWSERSPASPNQLNLLLGEEYRDQHGEDSDYDDEYETLVETQMAFSPSGKQLAIAATHHLSEERRPFPAQQRAIILVDALHPALPVIGSVSLEHVKHLEIEELEWSADSASLCAVCLSYQQTVQGGEVSYKAVDKRAYVFRFAD